MRMPSAPRFGAYVLFLVSLSGLARAACGAADPGDLASVLADAVSQQRANSRAIKTWVGQASILDEGKADGEVMVETKSRVAFAYRAEPAALRWNWDVVSAKGTARSFNTSTTNGIAKGGKLFLLEIPTSGASKGARQIRVVEPKVVPGSARQKFDPVYLSSYGGEDTASRLEILGAKADQWKLAKEGDLLTLSLSEAGVTKRYTVDLAKGASLVRYEAATRVNGILVNSMFWSWVYEEKEDIWVPVELAIGHEYLPKPGAPVTAAPLHGTTLRHIKWTESILNAPLDDSAFALEMIGVKEGDGIDDKSPLGMTGPRPASKGKQPLQARQ